ncbi:hypothetical protein QM806_25670 [Rhodococcus sp. IEGM 1351]|uniref:hypothetical protein n=1 Tax=Rhodococcus sp. IEGM 1351 TaxID=3047089 RepID=UPI0024B7840D|nr:hypothetical protein [Rhodococcus sp. IEGM 1351]MDI9938781.1 hypothetical protein [Rhodococcus sp. IEGM 1351]
MPARSRDELLEALDEQRQFLRSSAEDYDEGRLIEAKRMAVTLRVLFHNTRSSHALMNQLMLHNVLTWVDSAGEVEPENLLPQATLTHMRMTKGAEGAELEYVAGLDDRPPNPIRVNGQNVPRYSRIAFKTWWLERVVRDAAHDYYTRSSLVLALSNQEGGAHVDPKVRSAYFNLAKSNSLGWTVTDAQGDRPLDSNPVYPSVRQITYEVLESLAQQEHLLV